tara:strand:+ start:661 stop:1047 length:387 start_codon:yes stop_codon:yes gene_type:complete
MNTKKRTLKPLNQRKPEELSAYGEIIKRAAKKSRYRSSDVKIVIAAFLEDVASELKQKKGVRLPGIGTLFASIKPSRVGMALNGGVGKPVRIVVPDRWMLKFQPAMKIKKAMFKLPVSEEEIDNLYKD